MKKSHREHKAERRHKVEEEYKNAQALSGILEREEQRYPALLRADRRFA